MIIKKLLDEYYHEVDAAMRSFYFFKSFHNIISDDKTLLPIVNQSALLWNTILYSMLVTFFTALGRLFDSNKRSLSVYKFIDQCKKSASEFSKDALEKRCMDRARGIRPDYPDDFLSDVYEGDAAEYFHNIADEKISKWEEIYKKRYKPIRDKVIAHKDLDTIEKQRALFEETNIEEVENILEFLYQIHSVVERLFLNGLVLQLSSCSLPSTEGNIRKKLERLLRKLAG